MERENLFCCRIFNGFVRVYHKSVWKCIFFCLYF